MSWKHSEDDAALGAALDTWRAPQTPPWLAARVAAQFIAPRAKALWPWPARTKLAAIALALLVGWGVGMLMPAPEAAADGIAYAEVLW